MYVVRCHGWHLSCSRCQLLLQMYQHSQVFCVLHIFFCVDLHLYKACVGVHHSASTRMQYGSCLDHPSLVWSTYMLDISLDLFVCESWSTCMSADRHKDLPGCSSVWFWRLFYLHTIWTVCLKPLKANVCNSFFQIILVNCHFMCSVWLSPGGLIFRVWVHDRDTILVYFCLQRHLSLRLLRLTEKGMSLVCWMMNLMYASTCSWSKCPNISAGCPEELSVTLHSFLPTTELAMMSRHMYSSITQLVEQVSFCLL